MYFMAHILNFWPNFIGPPTKGEHIFMANFSCRFRKYKKTYAEIAQESRYWHQLTMFINKIKIFYKNQNVPYGHFMDTRR